MYKLGKIKRNYSWQYNIIYPGGKNGRQNPCS